MAVRAAFHLQELLYPLHPLFILDLGKGVFDSVRGVIIGEVQFSGLVRSLGVVEDVLLLGRAVEDDLAFFGSQVLERNVRPDSHLTAHVGHQRPHEGVPRSNGPLVDGKALVGDQRGLVNCPDRPRATAMPTGSLAVEGQFLGSGRIEPLPADRAHKRPFRSDVQRRRQVMAVGAAMAGKPREHQPEAVEQFRHGAERTPYAGNARALVERQGGGHVTYFVDHGP